MGSASEQLFARACEVIPGGVNSPVRSWRAVGGNPVFVARGESVYITDVDGRTYVDFVGSWGPLILGHAHPEVIAAVAEYAAAGTSFGAPTALEVDLACLVTDAMPAGEEGGPVAARPRPTLSDLPLPRAAAPRPGSRQILR